MISPLKATMGFLEAFLTVETASLGGVMMHEGSYVWPTYPALFLITLLATLAGFRRLNALFQTP